MRKHTILVVDDTPENLEILASLLKGEYTVRLAINGERALRIAASDPRPDLILLDIMMPGMDGYEVIRHLRNDPDTRDIPVIFVTAISDAEGEVRGLEFGAVDYIHKPFNPAVIQARVHTHLALADARAQIEQQHRALEREREIVERIIERMRKWPAFDETGIRFLMTSVDRASGDVLLSARLPDGRHWTLVGDFTGHGLPAAAGAPLISYIFYGMAARGMPCEEALAEINRVLCRQLPTNIFMACCFVETASGGRTLRVWNAGMPRAIYCRDGRTLAFLESRNLLLGIIDEFDAQEGCQTLVAEGGESLFIYSDGVNEATAPDTSQFGEDRTEAFLLEVSAGTRDLYDLPGLLAGHHESESLDDDVTLVEIRIQ